MASAASATADGGAGAGQPAGVALGPIERVVAFQQAFWKFLRPHTIRGTILGSIAVTARALIESPVVGPCQHLSCNSADSSVMCMEPGKRLGTFPGNPLC